MCILCLSLSYYPLAALANDATDSFECVCLSAEVLHNTHVILTSHLVIPSSSGVFHNIIPIATSGWCCSFLTV